MERTLPPSPSVLRGLESLPDELLVELAKHLEPHDTSKRANLRSLSLVSKKLNGCCNQACDSLSLSGLKASRLPRLLSRFQDLTSLNLSFLFDCSEESLVAVGRKCARLRELQVPDTCKAATNRNGKPGQGLQEVCRGCPNLAVLSLPSYKGPEGALLELGAAQQLRVLCLKGAQNLSDAVIAHIASSCRRIEEMDLSFNAITDASLRSIGSSLLHLKKLDLKHCKQVSGAGIAALAEGCRKLQTLHLGVLELDDSGLIALGRYSAELEDLCLDYSVPGQFGQFGQEALAALAQGCRKLRVLSLRGSKQVDDQSLRGLAKGCPSLQELDLHACSSVGDLGLHSIVLGCKQLRVLVLTGTGVGLAGEAAFRGGLPKLQVLRLNGELVTDMVLKSVGDACPALEELHLSSCLVSDLGLECVLAACKKLHSLALKSCGDVKATAFAAASLPHLHTVHLPSCGLTDQGLAAVARAAPALASLTIASCTKLSAAGIAAVFSAAPALGSVVATGCPQLSREDVLLLTKSAGPALKLLRVSRPGSLDDEYTLKRQSVGWALPCWARGGLGMSASCKY